MTEIDISHLIPKDDEQLIEYVHENVRTSVMRSVWGVKWNEDGLRQRLDNDVRAIVEHVPYTNVYAIVFRLKNFRDIKKCVQISMNGEILL